MSVSQRWIELCNTVKQSTVETVYLSLHSIHIQLEFLQFVQVQRSLTEQYPSLYLMIFHHLTKAVEDFYPSLLKESFFFYFCLSFYFLVAASCRYIQVKAIKDLFCKCLAIYDIQQHFLIIGLTFQPHTWMPSLKYVLLYVAWLKNSDVKPQVHYSNCPFEL